MTHEKSGAVRKYVGLVQDQYAWCWWITKTNQDEMSLKDECSTKLAW